MSTINYEAEYKKIKAREKKGYERRAAKVALILDKATKAGITVTEKEIDDEVARRKKTK